MNDKELLFAIGRASSLMKDFKYVIILLINCKEKYNEMPTGNNKSHNINIVTQMRYSAFNYYDVLMPQIINAPFINGENILSFKELKRICGVDFD